MNTTREPLLTRAALTAVITLTAGGLAAFGVRVGEETREDLVTVALLLASAAPLVLGWWARRHVTPTADPHNAAGDPLVSVDLPGLPPIRLGDEAAG